MQPHGDSGIPSLFGEEGGRDERAEQRLSKAIGLGCPGDGQRAGRAGGPTSEAPAGVWLACRSACPAASFLGLGLGGWSPEEPRVDFQGED